MTLVIRLRRIVHRIHLYTRLIAGNEYTPLLYAPLCFSPQHGIPYQNGVYKLGPTAVAFFFSIRRPTFFIFQSRFNSVYIDDGYLGWQGQRLCPRGGGAASSQCETLRDRPPVRPLQRGRRGIFSQPFYFLIRIGLGKKIINNTATHRAADKVV